MKKNDFWGKIANEEYHLFIINKNSTMPISIENIGYTKPNPYYLVKRDDHKYFVIEYILSGKGYLEIDGKKYVLNPGDIYCIQPGFPHTYYSDENNPFEKIWINFFSDSFVDLFKSFGIYKKFYYENVHCPELFHELLALTSISPFSDEVCFQVCSVLLQIICAMARCSSYQPIGSERANAVKAYLDDAIYSSITLEEISKKMNLSVVQITREFKKYYNKTPHNYLLDNKLKLVRKFLVISGYSVSEISGILGFSDPHYLTRIFTKKFGVSPTEYRKNNPKFKAQQKNI